MTDDLIERLKATEEEDLWYTGGYRHRRLRNPDGPEAAAALVACMAGGLSRERHLKRALELMRDITAKADPTYGSAHLTKAEVTRLADFIDTVEGTL